MTGIVLREVAGGLTFASDPEADDAVRRLDAVRELPGWNPTPTTERVRTQVAGSLRQLRGSFTALRALAGTARPPALRCNPATAQRLGLTAGAPATVRTERGEITLPLVIADLPDGVVWLPANSPGSRVRDTLGVGHGDLVGVSA